VNDCKPQLGGCDGGGGALGLRGADHPSRGRRPSGAVQIDPVKAMLKPPGTKHSKLKYDILLSTFAFRFHLRRHTPGLQIQTDAANHEWRDVPPVPGAFVCNLGGMGAHSSISQLNLSRV